MAWNELDPSGNYFICCRLGKKKFKRSLKTTSKKTADKRVDQRIIDDFTGHQTDEQRRRYRHLLPATTKQAIAAVFG
jgi:hypothetical protein